MEQEVLETQEVASAKEMDGAMNAMTILSMIGSGFYMLVGLLCIVASGMIADMFSGMGGFGAAATTLFIIVGVIILGLSTLTLLGAIRMRKFQKSGLVLYLIGNGIFLALQLLGTVQNATMQNIIVLALIGGFTGFFVSKRAEFS